MKAYERLLEYVKWPTVSIEESDASPSNPAQADFGRSLVDEMLALGIADAVIDADGYVYGSIPATPGRESAPSVGFIAHMDVVDAVPSENIKARIIDYKGGDVALDEAGEVLLSPADFPFMAECEGCRLIVTDGSTLLGADDKSGIAEILTMAEHFLAHPELPHGAIKIAFTPDEEIGRGADRFDLKRFGADWAYTLDGGAFGEVEYETFNAASARVAINGVSIHPGTAKGKMINASLLAMEYNSMLPALERPENTDGYEGYIMLHAMSGDCEHAKLDYILRDHDEGKLDDKISFMHRAEAEINRRYGEGCCRADVKKSYRNMSVIIKENWHLIDTAYACMREMGKEPVTMPVRGGTDGCVLSFEGLPCPNLGTGGYNYHGRREFACIEQMDAAVELIIKIVLKYGASDK